MMMNPDSNIKDHLLKKSELIDRLNKTINQLERFISDVLMPRDNVNKKVLTDLKKIVSDYKNYGEIEILYHLMKIEFLPVKEGEQADYTFGTSLSFEGEYTTLTLLINEIQDIIFEIKELSPVR